MSTLTFLLLLTNSVALNPSLQSKSPNYNKSFENLNEFNLKVGDKVNMNQYTFKSLLNYPKKTLRLSDLKEKKIIVLDFWSKYCSNCISSMPKMQELQSKYDKDIQIILVTSDNHESLKPLLNRSTILKTISLPIIMSDSILSTKLFPHATNPYHVWLDGNGNVLSTNYSQETNTHTIEEFLKTGQIKPISSENKIYSLPKFIQDPKGSILDQLTENIQTNVIYYSRIPTAINKVSNDNVTKKVAINKQYSTLLSNLPNYLGTVQYLTDSTGEPNGIRFLQCSLNMLISMAYTDDFKKTDYPDLKKWFYDSADLPKYYEPLTDTTNVVRYEMNENIYTYEVRINNYSLKDALKILKKDLEINFGITLKMENKKINTASFNIVNKDRFKSNITKDSLSETEIIQTKNKIFFVNSNLLDFLNSFSSKNINTDAPLILFNSNLITPYKFLHLPDILQKRFNISIKTGSLKLTDKNIQLLNEELKPYGIEIKSDTAIKRIMTMRNTF